MPLLRRWCWLGLTAWAIGCNGPGQGTPAGDLLGVDQMGESTPDLSGGNPPPDLSRAGSPDLAGAGATDLARGDAIADLAAPVTQDLAGTVTQDLAGSTAAQDLAHGGGG